MGGWHSNATKSRIWHRQRHEITHLAQAAPHSLGNDTQPLRSATMFQGAMQRNATQRQTFVRSRTHIHEVPTQRNARQSHSRSRNARPLYAALTHRQKAPALPVRDMTLAHFEVFLSVLC